MDVVVRLPPRCAVSREDREHILRESFSYHLFILTVNPSFLCLLPSFYHWLCSIFFLLSSSLLTITKNQRLWLYFGCSSQHFLCIVSFIHFSLPILMGTFMILFFLFLPFHDDSFLLSSFCHSLCQHSVCRRIDANGIQTNAIMCSRRRKIWYLDSIWSIYERLQTKH